MSRSHRTTTFFGLGTYTPSLVLITLISELPAEAVIGCRRERIGWDWGFELDCEIGFEGDMVRELGFEFVVGKRGSQWKWRGFEMENFTAVAERIHSLFQYFIRRFQ